MTVSTRTRFEVFKRDRFTCGYCGRTPPEVLLHVDHVVPRAAGGSDDITNLVTACSTCNLGKSDRLLDEGQAPVIPMTVVEDLQERIEQAKAYLEAIAGTQEVQDQQVRMVWDHWQRAYSSYEQAPWFRWPEERRIRGFLRELPLHRILEAVDIATARWDEPSERARNYLYGVCHRMVREVRGDQ